jgi:chemotaxis protein methyltransferase CheR
MAIAASLGPGVELSEVEFRQLRQLFHRQVGIQLSVEKMPLVQGRLAQRLRALGLGSYLHYYQHLVSPKGAEELEIAIDLITTHETYFFREARHFDFIRERILPSLAGRAELRAWSAACSSGAEAYTLAMLLDSECTQLPWHIVGTDVSLPVLASARRGLYPMERGDKIPPHYLKRYCRKGQEDYEGQFLVARELRERVEFRHGNLTLPSPELGQFDLILLRNVLIYFDEDTKRLVLKNVLDRLQPGGWLIVGHSDALHWAEGGLQSVSPSIYRKV